MCRHKLKQDCGWRQVKTLTPKNPKAMVYQLLAKGAQKVQNYLIESGALKPLDTIFRPVAAPVDLSLKKQ